MTLITQAGPNVTENRHLYIGGSDVPTILGINKYKTQYELALEKTGIKSSEFKGNEYTQYGNVMEPQIRDYINAVNMPTFIEATKTGDGIRSNVDGYDDEHKIILEIKTHGKTPTIKSYEAQMQLYMYHFDCEFGWLAMYERPEDFDAEFDPDRLEIKEVERDDEYIQKILEAIDTFWIRCEFLKDNPEATETEYYNFGQNEVAVLASKVQKMELQLIQFKELEKSYKEAKQLLHDKMEEYDVKKFDTGSIVITRKLPGTRESLDSTKLKKELPEIAEKYKKVSKVKGSIVIKIKETKEEEN